MTKRKASGAAICWPEWQSLRSRLLKKGVAHGLTVSPPNRDKLTMRSKPLKFLYLILSLSKDEVWIFAFFSIVLNALMITTVFLFCRLGKLR